MANLHNLYIVVPATEKLLAEPVQDGYRLAVIRWRETKEVKESGKKPLAPRAVLLPEIPLAISSPVLLRTKLREAIDKLQDDRVRDILEKHVADDSNLLNVRIEAEQVTEEGIASWLAEESTGGRLNGASIQLWFDESVKQIVQQRAIAAGKDAKGVEQVINGYRATYMKLASPVTPITQPILEKLTELMLEVSQPSNMDEKIARAIERRMPRNEADVLMEI